MKPMKVLAIEPDVEVQHLYKSYLSKRGKLIDTMSTISYEFDAHNYDVVIVNSEDTKAFITNIPYDHLIVTGNYVSPKQDGSWGLTKPFHMEELAEMLEVIANPELSCKERRMLN